MELHITVNVNVKTGEYIRNIHFVQQCQKFVSNRNQSESQEVSLSLYGCLAAPPDTWWGSNPVTPSLFFPSLQLQSLVNATL